MRFGWRESRGPEQDSAAADPIAPAAAAAISSSQARARPLPSAMESLVLLRTILLGVALVVTLLLAFVTLVIPPWIHWQRGVVGLDSQFDRLESSVQQLQAHTTRTDDHLRSFLLKCQQTQIATIVRTERVAQATKEICLAQTQNHLQTCRQVLHDAALVQNAQQQSVFEARQQLSSMEIELPVHAPLEDMQQLVKDCANLTHGSTLELTTALVKLSLAQTIRNTPDRQQQGGLMPQLCVFALLSAGGAYLFTAQRRHIDLARTLRSCSVSSVELWQMLKSMLSRFVIIEDLRTKDSNSESRHLRKLVALWQSLKDLPAAVYGS